MSNQTRTQLDALMAQVEEMWSHLGILFDKLNATDGWEKKHGADWTFADVPYHLAYCNRDIVLRGMEMGADYPEDEQEIMTTPEELGVWNASKFAERPAGQTAEQSVAQWRASCDSISQLTARMSDADLDSPFWMPLFSGWATARAGLEFCRSHDWSEFMQLRIHMGRQEPVPSPAITRAYLGTMMQFFPMGLNREVAAGKEFKAVMAFSDLTVGAWTIHVADGNASILRGAVEEPDLVITQSAETFEKTFRGIQSFPEAMGAGLIKISNMEGLATFGELFPMS